MAARVFDTYVPGAADTLVTFINSISDERIMCFAILVRPIFTPQLTSLSLLYIVYLCMCNKWWSTRYCGAFSMNVVQTQVFVYRLQTKITMLSQQGNCTPFIIKHKQTVTNTISLHLSCPNFAVPPYKRCQRFRIFCRHMSGKRDDPTILNALTKVGVWNGNVFYLAAPIPISPKFRCPTYIRVSTICCRHMSGKRDKLAMPNTLTAVGVWNGVIFSLAAPIPILAIFRCPPYIRVSTICCRHMSGKRDKLSMSNTLTAVVSMEWCNLLSRCTYPYLAHISLSATHIMVSTILHLL